MMKIENLVRPNIVRMKAYSSARSEYTGDANILLDANESPFATDVNRYPDPIHTELLQQIAKLKKITPQNIMLGNGSDELIDQIIRIFCVPGKDEILTCKPGFSMFKVAAEMNDVAVVEVPLTREFQLDTDKILATASKKVKVIFICSPNNPTGNIMREGDILGLLNRFQGIVVIDEAYIDFSIENSMVERLSQFPNLLILQTFSKARAMAGIRLGMAFASEEIIQYFNKVRMPYNVNCLTAERALGQLNDTSYLPTIDIIVKERKRLEGYLLALTMVDKVFSSDANFLLVRFKQNEKVFHYLREKGIVLRDRSSQYRCENCLRVTVGTKEENQKLIEILKELK